jgi:hypothetical protein
MATMLDLTKNKYSSQWRADNAVTGFFKDGSASIFLSRADYDKTIPWSGEAIRLSKLAKKTEALAGHTWHFKDGETLKRFAAAIGVPV